MYAYVYMYELICMYKSNCIYVYMYVYVEYVCVCVSDERFYMYMYVYLWCKYRHLIACMDACVYLKRHTKNQQYYTGCAWPAFNPWNKGVHVWDWRTKIYFCVRYQDSCNYRSPTSDKIRSL